MNNLTPMAAWRAGIDTIEATARAVDMPLRLDNANALPTSHSGDRNNKRKRLKASFEKERAGRITP
jgi:hypothetical protein